MDAIGTAIEGQGKRNPHVMQTSCIGADIQDARPKWAGLITGDGYRSTTLRRFEDATSAHLYANQVKARWERAYDYAEHQAMLAAFCEKHGNGRDYKTTEEQEMWFGWLGSFTLGWDAHKSYAAGHQR
jgi:hypothetical protein